MIGQIVARQLRGDGPWDVVEIVGHALYMAKVTGVGGWLRDMEQRAIAAANSDSETARVTAAWALLRAGLAELEACGVLALDGVDWVPVTGKNK